MEAARWARDMTAVKTLLEAGSDASIQDLSGDTAFDYALMNRHLSDRHTLEFLRVGAVPRDWAPVDWLTVTSEALEKLIAAGTQCQPIILGYTDALQR